jgi:hypothetical protein
LGDVARKAVQQEAVLCVGLLDGVEEHAHDDVVGNQIAAVHVPLGLGPELGATRHRVAQHVAGGEVGELELLGQALGLSPFARAGRAQENEIEL